MDQLALIRSFLETQDRMIVATSNEEHNPEAAIVGFASSEDLHLVFGTHTTTRKYKNLRSNPRVAIVFGNRELVTVQYEGVSEVLTGEELATYKALLFAKNPISKKYENDENQVYIKIIPKWIRYTDYSKDPQEIFEITL